MSENVILSLTQPFFGTYAANCRRGILPRTHAYKHSVGLPPERRAGGVDWHAVGRAAEPTQCREQSA